MVAPIERILRREVRFRKGEAEFIFNQVEKRELGSRIYFVVLSLWLLTETLSIDEAIRREVKVRGEVLSHSLAGFSKYYLAFQKSSLISFYPDQQMSITSIVYLYIGLFLSMEEQKMTDY